MCPVNALACTNSELAPWMMEYKWSALRWSELLVVSAAFRGLKTKQHTSILKGHLLLGFKHLQSCAYPRFKPPLLLGSFSRYCFAFSRFGHSGVGSQEQILYSLQKLWSSCSITKPSQIVSPMQAHLLPCITFLNSFAYFCQFSWLLSPWAVTSYFLLIERSSLLFRQQSFVKRAGITWGQRTKGISSSPFFLFFPSCSPARFVLSTRAVCQAGFMPLLCSLASYIRCCSWTLLVVIIQCV